VGVLLCGFALPGDLGLLFAKRPFTSTQDRQNRPPEFREGDASTIAPGQAEEYQVPD
jgi:hypothetical protein